MNGKMSRHVDVVRQRKFVLVAFLCFVAILQSGLRDINNLSENNDTLNYLSVFEATLRTPFSDLINNFTLFGTEYTERDGGYPIFIKLSQYISGDFTFFMFFTAAFFIIPLGEMISRYVKSYAGILLSFMIYFALFSNIVNCFMRQAIVLGLFLIASKYVILRDWKKYFGMMLIAFTIHNSSIVALPFYFIPALKNSKKWLLIALIVSPILLYLSGIIVAQLMVGTVYSVFINEDNYGVISVILLIEYVAVMSIVFYRNLEKKEHISLLIGGMIGSLLLLPFVRIGGSIMRISYYYILSIVPLVPLIIDTAFDTKFKNNKCVRFVVYFLSIGFFAYMYFK